MTVNLGTAFDTDLITLAGLNPDMVDNTTIDLINTAGATTIRAEIVTSVDTASLLALIAKYTPVMPVTPPDTTTDPTTPTTPTDPVDTGTGTTPTT